ncbi:hypothetical protein I4F81_009678 [Pyropia yezoensis]|uniref:Uncharacterized protein n=1 Tax=Pyropia yezoensis TaxID=2788 RepID=A0ACC3CA67_PYRYE|nr:hypothetical protein I4F81_009678 [Neopyropia yezoensis]
MATLFVRNLPPTATEASLAAHFSAAVGPVRRAIAVVERGSDRCVGYGFVQFALPADAVRAVDILAGDLYGGRPLRVEAARPRNRAGGRAAVTAAGGKGLGGKARAGGKGGGDGEGEDAGGTASEANGADAGGVGAGDADEPDVSGFAFEDAPLKRAAADADVAVSKAAAARAAAHPSRRGVPQPRGALPTRTVVLSVRGGGSGGRGQAAATIDLAAVAPLAEAAAAGAPGGGGVVERTVANVDGLGGTTAEPAVPSDGARVVCSSFLAARAVAAALHGAAVVTVPGGGRHLVADASIGTAASARRSRLIVRNLPFTLRPSDVRRVVEEVTGAGAVRSVHLPPPAGRVADHVAVAAAAAKGKKKAAAAGETAANGEDAAVPCGGFGFVELFLASDAKAAVERVSGRKVGGRVIAVDYALAKSRNPEELARTVFVRNLLFETSANELRTSLIAAVGAGIEQCVLVHDPVTRRPRGTAFVRFAAPEAAARAVTACAAGAGGIRVGGRPLLLSPAVDRSRASALAATPDTASGVPLARPARGKGDEKPDARNMHLAWVGYLDPDAAAAAGLSPDDIARREASAASKRAKLSTNPNAYVSDVRLSLRNLPLTVLEPTLRRVAVVAAGAGGVGGGYRAARVVRHVKVATDEARAAPRAARGEAGAPLWVAPRAARNDDDDDDDDGLGSEDDGGGGGGLRGSRAAATTAGRPGRSRGYAFIEFTTPAYARTALESLNNCANVAAAYASAAGLDAGAPLAQQVAAAWPPGRRLMAEYAVEDRRQVAVLERVREAARRNAERQREAAAAAAARAAGTAKPGRGQGGGRGGAGGRGGSRGGGCGAARGGGARGSAGRVLPPDALAGGGTGWKRSRPAAGVGAAAAGPLRGRGGAVSAGTTPAAAAAGGGARKKARHGGGPSAPSNPAAAVAVAAAAAAAGAARSVVAARGRAKLRPAGGTKAPAGGRKAVAGGAKVAAGGAKAAAGGRPASQSAAARMAAVAAFVKTGTPLA